MIVLSKNTQLPLLARLFVWSVVLEPLLFFIIVDVNLIAIGGHIARFLQYLVVFGFLIKVLSAKSNLKVPDIFSEKYRAIWLYIGFSIISTLFGILFYNSYNFEYSLRVSLRPFIEIIVLIYTFVYFVFFTAYFLKNENTIKYFFKIFFRLFLFSLTIGIIDLCFQYFFGYDLIGRHLLDNVDVGFRFHGLFGEPRDAFGALMLFVAVYYLNDYWKSQNNKRIFSTISIFIVGLLTLSLSAYLGIIFSILVIFVYYFYKQKNMEKLKFIFSVLFILVILMLVLNNTSRLSIYMNDFDQTYHALTERIPIDTVYRDQSVDLIPVWTRYNEIRDLDLTPLFFGSGIGSSSFTNIEYFEETKQFKSGIHEIRNPRSNLVRIFYEHGIIGLLLFINIFTGFIKKEKINTRKIIFPMLILLGCFLAHRSYVPFIYLGVLMSVVSQKKYVKD